MDEVCALLQLVDADAGRVGLRAVMVLLQLRLALGDVDAADVEVEQRQAGHHGFPRGRLQPAHVVGVPAAAGHVEREKGEQRLHGLVEAEVPALCGDELADGDGLVFEAAAGRGEGLLAQEDDFFHLVEDGVRGRVREEEQGAGHADADAHGTRLD